MFRLDLLGFEAAVVVAVVVVVVVVAAVITGGGEPARVLLFDVLLNLLLESEGGVLLAGMDG